MANWSSLILTNKGKILRSKVEAGQTKLTLTKIKLGDGVISTGQTLEGLLDLVSPKQIVGINSVSAKDSLCTVTGIITNVGLQAGYNLKELGLFATDPDVGEILYAVTTDLSYDYLPAEGGATVVSEEFSLNIGISNLANVTAVVDMNGLLTVSSAATLFNEKMSDHNTDPNAHSNLGINLRKNSKTYVVGDVAYSLNLPTWARLDCIQGGTTANTEPTWGNVTAGQVFTDGEVQWRIADVKSSGDSVGSIKAWLVKNIPAGWLDISTGAMVSRATYPELWAWVQANAPVISEADWQTQANAQSSVGAFSTGDGSTTFRLPRIVDYVRGGTLADAGTWQGDAIRNITGGSMGGNSSRMDRVLTHGDTFTNGAFKFKQNNTNSIQSGTGGGVGSLDFDASLVVPTAEENRPKTIKMVYCIKAFGSPTNQGLIDITALANEMAGKVNQTQYDAENGFTIIYPNGGTKASPASVSINSRYVCDNPFPGYYVQCRAEIYFNNMWCETGWTTTSINGYADGVKATQLLPSDKVVVQTAISQLGLGSSYSGNGFGTGATNLGFNPLPCRVLVWKVGGKIE